MLTVAVCAMLAGCSGPPAAADGKQAVLDKIKTESEGRIELASFEKTNGMQGEMAGVKTYDLEFEAEITFLDNCKWSTGLIAGDGGMSFHTYKLAANPNSPMGLMENVMNGPGTEVKKGESFNVSGVIRYLNKERGWSAERIDLKGAKRAAEGIEGDMQRISRAMRTGGKDAAKVEAAKQACILNLMAIDSAKDGWAAVNRKAIGNAVDDTGVNSYLKNSERPKCPSGGTYTYGTVGSKPTCSISGHALK